MSSNESAQQLNDAIFELLRCVERDAERLLKGDGNASDGESAIRSNIEELRRCLRDYERGYSQLENECLDYKREYSRYRSEYDRVMASGSVKALFKLKQLVGRAYRPLFPAHLPLLDDDPYVLYARGINEDEVGTAPSAQYFSRHWKGLIEPIKDSNGSGYYSKLDMRAGIITDEYMYNYYKDALDFEYIAADSYETQLEHRNLSFVLFVSCWHGMDGGGYGGEGGRKKVIEVFEHAKALGIPTIFQTIEDPTNYLTFLDIAKHADHIFTSDANMVDVYIQDTGNENVHVSMYGINPLFHNPIGFMTCKQVQDDRLVDTPLFAGSWYWRYPKRCDDCARIFDGAIESSGQELVIIDRNSKLPAAKRGPHIFPGAYQPYVVDAIGHDELQKVHRLFDYAICLNTIKDSETMCAMRVYELQALGSLMLSNYALSVSTRFPSIFMISNSDEVGHILAGYTRQEVFNMQVEGIRRMYSGCTVFDRLEQMFHEADIPAEFESHRIAVVCDKSSLDPARVEAMESHEGVAVLDESSTTAGVLQAAYDYVVWPSQGLLDYEFFLEDAINAFKFADVDCVAYLDGDRYQESYDFIDGIGGKADALFSLSRVELERLDDPAYLARLKGFSVARTKWGRSTQDTTKRLGVIVPIYNNGAYLKDRCFLSLLRSSVFNEMTVYLVDDGSSDLRTLEVIDELCAEYDNVVAHRCGDSGSGSASRPRNEGLKICTEPYVTYLDPDNEAIGDGYAKLLHELEGSPADFAIGNIIRIAEPAYEPITVAPSFETGLNENPLECLIASKFMPRSIQAAVIKREFLVENSIENVEGAIGQDSLFYMEMMMNAHSFIYLNALIHIYYAERGGSAVNSVSRRFFEKSLLLEERQVEILRTHGLLEDYKDLRLGHFMEHWYLKKLALVGASEQGQCEEVVERIRALYL